jgi:hypothetical protein
MKTAVFACAAAVIALAADPASAGLFSSSKKKAPKGGTNSVVMPPPQASAASTSASTSAPAAKGGVAMARRVHMKFADTAAEEEFLVLTGARRRVQEDAQVITRIMSEKKMEIARFQKDLQDEFSIKAEENYQFDDKTETVFLLKVKAHAPADGQGTVEDRFEKTEHMKLNEEQKTRFLRIVAAKQLATEELSILNLLQNEKSIEANTVHEQMVAKYAISNDREYRYDRTSKTLFELVPVPAGARTSDGASEAVAR